MQVRKILIGAFLASIVAFSVAYVLTNSYQFGLCFSDVATNSFDVSCHHFYERLANPLFYGMGALTLIFLLLLFVPRAFSAWWKFAIWFVPLAAVIFIFAPEPQGWVSPVPAPEQVFQWVSALYVLISIVIIAWNAMRTK
jgi:uncharacterized membrane protein